MEYKTLFGLDKSKIKETKKSISLPWATHIYFTNIFLKYFPDGYVLLKPGGKELKKWKILIENFGEERVKKIIEYSVENYFKLKAKFKWTNINCHVICAYSESILGIIEEKVVLNRATNNEKYETFYKEIEP